MWWEYYHFHHHPRRPMSSDVRSNEYNRIVEILLVNTDISNRCNYYCTSPVDTRHCRSHDWDCNSCRCRHSDYCCYSLLE